MYAGFSFGASVAQTLALGDDKARGLLLPARHVGHRGERLGGRTAGTAARRRARPVRDRRLAHRLVPADGPDRADVEVYRYAGAGHLYTDPDLPDYDEERPPRPPGGCALGFLDSLED
ncbi:hypothetical protein GCM10023238_12490 [Streptomyces heliomycini]